MRSLASSTAIFCAFFPKRHSVCGSSHRPATVERKSSGDRFFSSMTTAAPRSSSTLALCYWWFSATFGDGINTQAVPLASSSLRVIAPAREITRSAAARQSGISSM